MGESEDTDKGVVAERLSRLFANFTPEGRRYTLREAAEGINEKAGRTVVSFQYLNQLANGTRREPTREKLQAIADWFGVKLAYFYDDDVAQQGDEDMRMLEILRDNGVSNVLFRAGGLSEGSLKLVVDLLDHLRNSEGLPPVDANSPDEESPASSD